MSKADLDRLNALIEQARGYRPTPEEFRQQQIGWVVGNTDEGLRLTRDEAEALLTD